MTVASLLGAAVAGLWAQLSRLSPLGRLFVAVAAPLLVIDGLLFYEMSAEEARADGLEQSQAAARTSLRRLYAADSLYLQFQEERRALDEQSARLLAPFLALAGWSSAQLAQEAARAGGIELSAVNVSQPSPTPTTIGGQKLNAVTVTVEMKNQFWPPLFFLENLEKAAGSYVFLSSLSLEHTPQGTSGSIAYRMYDRAR